MTIHNKERLRWAFNIGEWNPTPMEWQNAMSALDVEKEEQSRIMRFVREKDRKSALIGRLLQRRMICFAFGWEWNDIKLERTREGKPFWANMPEDIDTPIWNYNVSHHGDWVVCACDPWMIVGSDVTKIELTPGSKTNAGFFENMTNCFTPYEWTDIKNGTSTAQSTVSEPMTETKDGIGESLEKTCFDAWSEEQQMRELDQFFLHWALKEAYIKAVGIGLGFELQRAEYHWSRGLIMRNSSLLSQQGHGFRSPVTIRIDGIERKDWIFEIFYLDTRHIVAVATGPVRESWPTYSRSMNFPQRLNVAKEKQVQIPPLEDGIHSRTFRRLYMSDLKK